MTLATRFVLRAMLGHGTEMYARQIAAAAGLPSGTVAPMLIRLETAGWVKARSETGNPHKLGRPLRRYYVLTDEGNRIATEDSL